MKTIKFIKTAAVASSLIFVVSCQKGKEYALNEAMAEEFYKTKQQYEDTYKAFIADVENGGKGSATVLPKIEAMEKTVNEGITNVIKVQVPTPESTEMIEEFENYLAFGKGAFGYHLKSYYTEEKPEMKEDAVNVVKEEYQKIGAQEDKLLEVQREYFKKVGLEGKMPE